MNPLIVKCPTCGKPIEWTPEQLWRPFCSERCKLIDLGDWAAERHRIPGDHEEHPTEDGQLDSDDGE